MRPVPAALPDVPCHWRGVVVAAWPHRADAAGAVGGCAGGRRVRVVHGCVRAVPRLRDRLSRGGAVRPADGAHPPGAGPHAPVLPAVVAPARVPSAGLPLARARGFEPARARAAPAPPEPRPCGASRTATAAAVAPRPAHDGYAAWIAAHVPVHRMRDGRVAARRP